MTDDRATPDRPARNTALQPQHVLLGASLTTFAGWNMPVRYASDLEEHHAVRRSAGLFDLSHMGQITVTGAGAGDALDHALVGWISQLSPGRAKYTMMSDEHGGIVDDLVVYRLAQDDFLVVAIAGNHPAVLAELVARSGPFAAAVENRSETHSLIAVQGPSASSILQQVSGADVPSLGYYAIVNGDLAGVPVHLARTGYTGEDGFEIYVDSAYAGDVWNDLLDAGSPLGLKPAGLSCAWKRACLCTGEN